MPGARKLGRTTDHRKAMLRAMVTFLLENGVCSYSGLGDGYNTDDCYWEIIKNGDYTHDSIREWFIASLTDTTE